MVAEGRFTSIMASEHILAAAIWSTPAALGIFNREPRLKLLLSALCDQ